MALVYKSFSNKCTVQKSGETSAQAARGAKHNYGIATTTLDNICHRKLEKPKLARLQLVIGKW